MMKESSNAETKEINKQKMKPKPAVKNKSHEQQKVIKV